jgi:hypothetical protein
MSQEYDRVVVEGPSSSEFLYEFADVYIANDTKPNTSDGYNGEAKNPSTPEEGAKVVKPVWNQMGKPEMGLLRKPYKPHPDKEWKSLAPKNPEFVADILCAFRPVKNYRGKILKDKEYPKKLCVQLVGELLIRGFSVACIGGSDNYHIPGTVDLRGKSLEDQCSAIAAGKVVAGPSSGPLHLAALCGTPQVVWYNRPNQITSYARYESHWNPFGTPHTYLKQQVPAPSQIAEAVEGHANG